MKKTLLKALRVSNSIILADRLRFFITILKAQNDEPNSKKEIQV